jgi:hypothetical protein
MFFKGHAHFERNGWILLSSSTIFRSVGFYAALHAADESA